MTPLIGLIVKREAYVLLKELEWEESVVSFTFIAARLEDNQLLLQNDPSYSDRLNSMLPVERERYLKGNWIIKPSGKIFKREFFQIFTEPPLVFECILITMDTAQETKSQNDYTVIQVWGRFEEKIYLLDQVRGKWDIMTQVSSLHGLVVMYKPNWISVELKSNGHAVVQMMRKQVNTPFINVPRVKDKYARALDMVPYVQNGQVYLDPSSQYYKPFIGEVTTFEVGGTTEYTKRYDDQVDTFVDAMYLLLFKKIAPPNSKRLTEIPKNPKWVPYEPKRYGNFRSSTN